MSRRRNTNRTNSCSKPFARATPNDLIWKFKKILILLFQRSSQNTFYLSTFAHHPHFHISVKQVNSCWNIETGFTSKRWGSFDTPKMILCGLIKMSNIFFFLFSVTSRDRCNSEPHGANGKKNSRKNQMPWLKKMWEFYKSPTAKFWANAVSC